MDIVIAFNTNTLHSEIVIKGTMEDPLFRASDIGEVLEMTNIRTATQCFDNTEKVILTTHSRGGDQQTTFLTEKGLYKVLFKSRKPIAEQFQNWVCEVVKELRLKGKYELTQLLEEKDKQIEEKNKIMEEKDKQIEEKTRIMEEKDKQIKEKDKQIEEKNRLLEETEKLLENTVNNFDVKLVKDRALEKEKFLLNENANIGPIVYIIKVKSFENGTYIVKIGESRRGIELRYKEHYKNYDECLLLDVFPVLKSKDFETFIHTHDEVKNNKVKYCPNHENENELFLVGEKLSYQALTRIIRNNIKRFKEPHNKDYDKLIYKNETLEEIIAKQNANSIKNTGERSINMVLYNLLEENQKSKEETNKYNELLLERLTKIEENMNSSPEKATLPKITTITGEINRTVGDRLLQINPETNQIVKVYETLEEAMKESNYKHKRPSIQKAVTENTIYHEYRWFFAERNQDPNEAIKSMKETKVVRVQNNGFVAKLNADKTEIMDVYLDRKTASLLNKYSIYALDNAVKNKTIKEGHYYLLYDDCEEDLREEFVEKYGEPLLYKDGVGQYNEKNELVQEFVCKYDVIKKVKVGDKSLRKVMTDNLLYNGFFYKALGEKLQMVVPE